MVTPVGFQLQDILSSRTKIGAFLGFGLMSYIINIYIIIPASIFPVIIEDLGIGPTSAGLIVSVVLVGMLLTSLPIGVLIDRFGNTALLTVAAVLLIISSLWSWQAAIQGSFLTLLYARLLGGVAFSGIWNTGMNVVSSIFSTEHRATAVGVYTSTAPAGWATGQLVGPKIAQSNGWPAIFYWIGVFTFAALVIVRVFGPDSEMEDSPQLSSVSNDLAELFRDSSVWFAATLSLLGYSLYVLVNSWMPSYLNLELGMTLTNSGLYVALFPAIGIISRSSGGFISDRYFNNHRRPVLLISFLVSGPVLVLFWYLNTPIWILALLATSGFFIQLGIGLFYTYVWEMTTDSLSGAAISLLTTMNSVGAISAPVLAGLVIEETSSYFLVFMAAGTTAFTGAIITYFAPESG